MSGQKSVCACATLIKGVAGYQYEPESWQDAQDIAMRYMSKKDSQIDMPTGILLRSVSTARIYRHIDDDSTTHASHTYHMIILQISKGPPSYSIMTSSAERGIVCIDVCQ